MLRNYKRFLSRKKSSKFPEIIKEFKYKFAQSFGLISTQRGEKTSLNFLKSDNKLTKFRK